MYSECDTRTHAGTRIRSTLHRSLSGGDTSIAEETHHAMKISAIHKFVEWTIVEIGNYTIALIA